MANLLDKFYISHVSRLKNTQADALAALASTLALPTDTSYNVSIATHQLFCSKYSLEVNKVHAHSIDFEPKDWRFPFIDYALYGILPDDPKEAISIKRRSGHFHYNEELKLLYHRSPDGLLLHCLSNAEVQEVVK